MYPLEVKSACVITNTLIYTPVDKEHKVYDDERMSMNSEGKIHRMDEEQVLADGKPLRQAGGSHELPFELMQKTRSGASESDREGLSI